MLTFTTIKGAKALSKTFTPEGVSSYPLVKKVTSKVHTFGESIQGLRDKVATLRSESLEGAALLKGPLRKTLTAESRAGHCDTDAMSRNIVIDIDGLDIGAPVAVPLTKADITALAEHCVRLLPEAFHNTAYIVHASSSLGLKPNHRRSP